MLKAHPRITLAVNSDEKPNFGIWLCPAQHVWYKSSQYKFTNAIIFMQFVEQKHAVDDVKGSREVELTERKK